MNQDFLDLISAFINADVRFVVVGGYAVAAHGYPRATKDIDVFVEGTPDNAHRVIRALGDFGAPLFGLTADDLSRPGKGLMMGSPPRRIDILTQISGVTFEEAWPSRQLFEIAGLRVPFIGRQRLIDNKRASGRPQDLVDVERLDAVAASTDGDD